MSLGYCGSPAEHRLELTGSCSMDGHATNGIAQVHLQEKWRSQFLARPLPAAQRVKLSIGWRESLWKFTENPHFYLRLKLRRLPLRSFLNQCWESGIGITSASPKCQGAQASSQATRAFSSSAFMQSCGSIHRSRSQTAWESQLWRPHGYGSKGHE